MKKFLKSIALVTALLCASFAVAQYPESPNTGKQTTPYTSVQFNATFNGSVNVSELMHNTAKTSVYRLYTSSAAGVYQTVAVRFIDHAIPVDFTSSEFYAAHADLSGGTITNQSNDVWEGHPFTYIYVVFSADGVNYVTRTRFIIVSATEAIFISQTAPATADDRDQWLDFEYSLRIK